MTTSSDYLYCKSFLFTGHPNNGANKPLFEHANFNLITLMYLRKVFAHKILQIFFTEASIQ